MLYPGLFIPVRLLDALSSETNRTGDPFMATVDQEIVVDGFVIVERGALVEGVVTAVDRAAGRLTLELTRLYTSDKQQIAIRTENFERRPDAPPLFGDYDLRAIRNAVATLISNTRMRFRLSSSILLTEKLN